MSSNSKKLSGNNSTKSTIAKLLKVPAKILAKARDLYVRSLIDCSGQVGYGAVMGCPTGQYIPSALPKSYSVKSSRSVSLDEDDYRELVRIASARSMSGRKGIPRSRSVGIGRIDEDRPSDFGNNNVVLKTDLHLRSKSYSGAKGRKRFYY